MKRFRNVFAFLLALVMMMSLGTTALAATVTIVDTEDLGNHTFVAYKVFSGSESGGVLSNVAEGDVPFNELLEALQADDSALKSSFPVQDGNGNDITYTPAMVAQIMSAWTPEVTKEANAKEFAKIAHDVITAHNTDTSNTKITGTTLTSGNSNNLEDGYYLIIDETTFTDGQTGTMVNASLLQVVGDITIQTKTDKPEMEKLILEDKPGENNRELWQTHGDYEIGQEISFRYNSTLPNISNYDTYEYIFHDDMSDGLTFVENSMSVKITWTGTDEVEHEKTLNPITETNANGYTLTMASGEDADTDDFTLTIKDLKAIANEIRVTNATTNAATSTTALKVVVTYKGKLNDDAIVGLYGTANPGTGAQTGNPNTAYLEYSNNPNGEGTGRTEDTTVYAFTFTLEANKINSNNEKLADAEFYLYKESISGSEWSNNSQTVTVTHSYAKLDTDSSNAITDYTVTGWSDVTNTYTRTRSGSEGNYTYTYSDNSESIEESAIHKSTAPSDATKLTSTTDKNITVTGLDGNDTYYLCEVKAPDTYNLLDGPVEIEIRPTYSSTTNLLTGLSLVVDGGTASGGVVNTGVATVNITNNKGSELPQTGARGTILFVTFGTIAALGAAVLMITKKKMSIYED